MDVKDYICPECGAPMRFADEEVLVCTNSSCNYSIEVDDYDDDEDEKYSDLYPTKEEYETGEYDD
jgi:hypothetical protein